MTRLVLLTVFTSLISACGGSGSSNAPANPAESVSDPEEQEFSGKVIDGYIGNAVVCLDLNNNFY